MKCKVCGNSHFIGHQLLRADIICDEDGLFEDNLKAGLEASIYDSEKPYGSFTCTICGAEYDDLKENEEPLNRGEISLDRLREVAALAAMDKMGMSAENRNPRNMDFAIKSLGEVADAAHAGKPFSYAFYLTGDEKKLGIHISCELYHYLEDVCNHDRTWYQLNTDQRTKVFAKWIGIVLDIPKTDWQDINSLSALKTLIAAECDKRLGLPGYSDYLESNLGAAIETVIAQGNIYDVDAIVHLEKLLDMHVSYGLYHYINSAYDETSLEELNEEDIPRLMRHVIKYIKGEEIYED